MLTYPRRSLGLWTPRSQTRCPRPPQTRCLGRPPPAPWRRGLLLAPDHLPRERTAGFPVMKQRRLAEGGRLREADIARDDGAKHLVAEVRDELRAHLVGEVVAGVEHGAQHALDRELRICGHADL